MSAARASADAARLPLMLTDLRLPTIKRLWSDLAAQSDREGWRAERLLSVLFEHEMADLPPDKSLDSFDFAAVPSLAKPHVAALIAGDGWLEQGANVLLFGPPGVGKSHLIAAIGHGLIDRGWRVLFTRTGDLVQRLQAARRDLRLPAELARLDRFDLLILDDFSYVRRDQAESSVLFELISERYERKSIAITANQPFSAWDQVFPEAAMTLAAVDRLVHHSTIFELNVESYRRKAAAEGKTAGKAKLSKGT